MQRSCNSLPPVIPSVGLARSRAYLVSHCVTFDFTRCLTQKRIFVFGHRKRLPIVFCSSRPYKALSTLCLTGNSSLHSLTLGRYDKIRNYSTMRTKSAIHENASFQFIEPLGENSCNAVATHCHLSYRA